jgi:hypothetical protein
MKGVSGQQHAPAVLYPRERPGTHCTKGWVGSRDGLDGGKYRPTGVRSPEQKHYYGEEIGRWQLQNKREVTHYEVSELFGNALFESANRKNSDN